MKMNPIHHQHSTADGYPGLSRRGFLRGVSAAGIGSLGLLDLVALRAEDLQKKGMSVIVLWMQGGPSQFETFDPKPGHDNSGPTEAIKTSVEGIQVAQHWPLVAEQMKDIRHSQGSWRKMRIPGYRRKAASMRSSTFISSQIASMSSSMRR